MNVSWYWRKIEQGRFKVKMPSESLVCSDKLSSAGWGKVQSRQLPPAEGQAAASFDRPAGRLPSASLYTESVH